MTEIYQSIHKSCENYWDDAIDYFGGEYTGVLVLGLLTYLIVYVGGSSFFTLLDILSSKIPFILNFRLQPKVDRKEKWWNCFVLVITNHLYVVSFLFYGYYYILPKLPVEYYSPLPHFFKIFLQIIVYLMVEDFLFYWVHRTLHHPDIYRVVHKTHHNFKAPFAFSGNAVHPIEFIISGSCQFVGCLIWPPHVFTLYIWIVVRVWINIEDHCGYRLYISPTELLPFFGSSKFHDDHHKDFKGNYASTFTYLDRIFGTTIIYDNDKDNEKKY
eukprot:TRINITY_DN4861_c0_g1_i1.p1 TRINITY_DN4861_c0_g1~~TRINITY_DN4861_c0_g1_i1.p1  ORF type:complete len:271 (-),score=40.34 TRINITY_DN4861_c0_g1_i1:3-815(-)